MSKDIIVATIRILIGAGILTYTGWLYNQGLSISFNADSNLGVFVFLGILGAVFMIIGVVAPCVKRPKLTQVGLGVFLILFAYYTLLDDPSKYIYLSDILKVLGVVLIILGPTGLCIPEKCVLQAKIEAEKKIEIIEV